MRMSKAKTNQIFSYADYLKWPEGERWEIIDGIAYDMTPAPSILHQKILTALLGEFYLFLKGKTCQVLPAPVDVRFPAKERKDEDIQNIVQPDIIVVCDENKLDRGGCNGAPDIIIEILSPSTASKDVITKMNVYEKNKVKEYWIVDPSNRLLTTYFLDSNGKYGRGNIHDYEAKVSPRLFPDLRIDLQTVFPKIK